MLSVLLGLRSTRARPGSQAAAAIPAATGSPRISATVVNMSAGSREKDVSSSAIPGSQLAQKPRLAGVATTAAKLETAVMPTDTLVRPPPMWVMKLEMLPPGQQATRSMPRATLGPGPSRVIRPKQAAGSTRNCVSRPMAGALGFLTKATKSLTFRSRATPNMMRATMMLSVRRLAASNASSTWSMGYIT